MPPGRTVVRFSFADVSPEDRHWWVVITPEGVDLCSFDPGHPVTASIETELRTFTRVWRGELSWSQSHKSGAVQVHGPAHVRRNLPRWIPKTGITVQPQPA